MIIWSIVDIALFVTLVGLFIVGTRPNWNTKLTKFSTFLFCSKYSMFMLKSPAKITLLFLIELCERML